MAQPTTIVIFTLRFDAAGALGLPSENQWRKVVGGDAGAKHGKTTCKWYQVDGRKSHSQPLGDVWNIVENGIKYQPQLVNAGFQPSTVGKVGIPTKIEVADCRDLNFLWVEEEDLSASKESRETRSTRWRSTQEMVYKGGFSGWLSHISSCFFQTKCKGLFLASCEWYKTRFAPPRGYLRWPIPASKCEHSPRMDPNVRMLALPCAQEVINCSIRQVKESDTAYCPFQFDGI